MDNQPTPVGPEQSTQPTPTDQNLAPQLQSSDPATSAPSPSMMPESPAPAPETPVTPQTFQPSPQPMQPGVQDAQAQPMGAPQPISAVSPHDPGHGLGIASLITSILGFGLVGVILGFIAIRKSKGAGRKGNVLGLVGVILGFLNMIAVTLYVLLVLVGFGMASNTANDVQLKTNARALSSKLEEYFNENNGYPKTLDIANFPGMDSLALEDGNGNPAQIRAVETKAEAEKAEDPSEQAKYIYVPYGCSGNLCRGFILKTYTSQPTETSPNPFVIKGLNNL